MCWLSWKVSRMCVHGKANSPEGLFVNGECMSFHQLDFSFVQTYPGSKKCNTCTYSFVACNYLPKHVRRVLVVSLSPPRLLDNAELYGWNARKEKIHIYHNAKSTLLSNKFALALRLVCYHNAKINTICMLCVRCTPARSSAIENNLDEHMK